MSKNTRIRSAVTGKFTTGEAGGESPDTTVRERVRPRTKAGMTAAEQLLAEYVDYSDRMRDVEWTEETSAEVEEWGAAWLERVRAHLGRK